MNSVILNKIGRELGRNSPKILTGLGVVGVITTTVLAVRATPKAMILMENFREVEKDAGFKGYRELSPKEIIRLTWKCYIPATVMGGVTIAAIIAANSIHLQRNAALISLFGITQTALQEYQAKVVETIGEKKEALLRGEIAQDRLKEDPIEGKTVIITGNGLTLCYDRYSGRYFESSVETINRVVNEFNKKLLVEGFLDLNDFYYRLGLEPINAGAYTGWHIEKGLLEVYFSSKLATNSVPCLVLEYSMKPKYNS